MTKHCMALENTQLDSQAIIPSILKELTDGYYGSLIISHNIHTLGYNV